MKFQCLQNDTATSMFPLIHPHSYTSNVDHGDYCTQEILHDTFTTICMLLLCTALT